MTLRSQLEASGHWLFQRRSFLPLLVLGLGLAALRDLEFPRRSHALQEVWNLLCLGLALAGQALRFYTIGQVPAGTSGRNRRDQRADSLNTTGIYSVVRNPLYLGNCLIWLGVAAVPRSPWLFLTVGLVFWLYHERIILAEERYLEDKYGEEFRRWAAVTPVFIPRWRNWRPAALRFSFRHALGREYLGVFGVLSTFLVLDAIEDSVGYHRLTFPVGWLVAWLLALAAFVVIRVLRKKTRLLVVEGR